MNPAVFAGVLAVLLASSAGARQRPGAPIPAAAVVAVLVWLIVGPAFVVELLLLLEALGAGALQQALIHLGLALASAVVLFPWAIARMILIPLGQVRLSWAITRLSFWVWRRDLRGGAALAGSWAAIRRAQAAHARQGAGLEQELLAWIEGRCRDHAGPRAALRWTLGAAGVVATGLLAAARRDHGSAHRLLRSAMELPKPSAPKPAIEAAALWLCADAMEAGAWAEVGRIVAHTPVTTRRLRLVQVVAARVAARVDQHRDDQRREPPGDLRLCWAWLVAPGRLRHFALLRRALRVPAAPASANTRAAHERRRRVPPPPPSPGDDALLAALAVHAFTLGCPAAQLLREDLTNLAVTWDRALADPELERRLVERGEALGCHEHSRRPALLAETVRDDLLALVRAAGLELGQFEDSSELLARAARQLHAELLDGLETSAAALEPRVEAKRALPSADEWQTFLALREQYDAAVELGGASLRRLAFQTVHGPLCSLAVWLWNERSERALGNAMFNWLLEQAIIVDDAEAIRLQERNVNCGL